MNEINIITLSGPRGAGKTTISMYLEKYNYKILSFAEIVKDIVHLTHGFNRQMLEGDTLENRELRLSLRESNWNQNAIEAMETTADMYKKKFGENIWAKILISKINQYINEQTPINKFVISDLRFNIEYLDVADETPPRSTVGREGEAWVGRHL